MPRTSRLLIHAPAFIVLWIVLSRVNTMLDPLWSYYLALTAMYATAMMGMVILVGLSGQVSLGNGALMAVGGYAFAVSSMHMSSVPLLGLPWNAVWSMVVAGLTGVAVGAAVGALGARLRGPYLAGLTLGLAVGIPALASRFPELLGGSQGLLLQVPYPEGGYVAESTASASEAAAADEAALDAALGLTSESPAATSVPSMAPEDMLTADDMLTVEDVTGGGALGSASASVAPEDMLTVEDVTGGGALESASAAASAPPSPGIAIDPMPSASVPTDAMDPATSVVSSAGFVLEQWQASVAIALACIMGFVALNLVRGRQGQVWRAVRDDPIAAAVTGMHPGRAKVSAFVISSLFAALAGAVFVQILAYAGPGAFTIGLSLSLLVGVILGGRNSLVGAVLGAVLLVGLPVLISRVSGDRGWPDQVAANSPSLIYGLLVILVVLVLPGGLVSLFRRRRTSRSN